MYLDLGHNLKIARAAWLVGSYVAQASLIRVSERDPIKRRDRLVKNVSSYARRLLRMLDFEVEVFGQTPSQMQKSFLVVSNHMSYMDIITLSSVQPSVFVTSVDMGETAGLGKLADLGGSLFVERRNRKRIEEDIGRIADVLEMGQNVVIYPEGTSTDGLDILPFKRSLFRAAELAECEVLPLCVKYTLIRGEAFSRDNHSEICWYGDMGFLPHFRNLVQQGRIRCELHFLEPIRAGGDRNELIAEVHQKIREKYHSR